MTTAVHHDQDFYSWAMQTAQLVREGRLAEIDCEYVAEELEDMGAAKEREFAPFSLEQVLDNAYWPG